MGDTPAVPTIPLSPTEDQVAVTTTTSGQMSLKRYNNLPSSSGTASLVKTGGAVGTFHLADDHIRLPPDTTYASNKSNRWWNNSGFICVGNTGDPVKNVSLSSDGKTLTTLKFDGNSTAYTLPVPVYTTQNTISGGFVKFDDVFNGTTDPIFAKSPFSLKSNLLRVNIVEPIEGA